MVHVVFYISPDAFRIYFPAAKNMFKYTVELLYTVPISMTMFIDHQLVGLLGDLALCLQSDQIIGLARHVISMT